MTGPRAFLCSPYAPSTPLPPGGCTCAASGLGLDPTFRVSLMSCAWCDAKARREGELARNLRYLRACLRDSLARGEAPFAPHRMYADALDDAVPEDRARGAAAGLEWLEASSVLLSYEDLGISQGMGIEAERAGKRGIPVVRRKLGEGWDRR